MSGWSDLQHLLATAWPGPAVTYSFVNAPPPGADYGELFVPGTFETLSESQIEVAHDLLKGISAANNYRVSFSDIANISFSHVLDDTGNITLGRVDIIESEEGGHAFARLNLGLLNDGDIWLDNNEFQNPFDPEKNNLATELGQEGYWIILHELGHAFGGLRDAVAAFQASIENNQQFTVMSYDPIGTVIINGQPGSSLNSLYLEDGTFLKPYGLQLYDIKAIQDAYGANTTTRSGDTVYALGRGLGRDGDPDKAFIYTIWDGGGEDTLDVSGFGDYAARIDLRAGEFSSIGTTGFFENGTDPRGAYDASRGIDAKNVAIAYDVLIENAIGGNSADHITGNGHTNRLVGGRGNDFLFGESGDDIYVWNPGDGTDEIADTAGVDTLLLGRGITEEMLSGQLNVEGGTLQVTTAAGYGGFITSTGVESLIGLSFQNVTYTGEFTNTTTNTPPSTNGNDVIIGTSANDFIFGGFGDDILRGGDGDDFLSGGAGVDQLFGEGGNDSLNGLDTLTHDVDLILSGGDGNDWLRGSRVMHGGAGNDYILEEHSPFTSPPTVNLELFGEGGNDKIVADAFSSRIDGGDDADLIHIEGDNNFIHAGDDDAADVLFITGIGNTILGGGGNDVISVFTDSGNIGQGSVIDAGSGDDVIHLGRNRNTVKFSPGHDVIYHEQHASTVTVLDFGALAPSNLYASYLGSMTDLTVGSADGWRVVLVDYKLTPNSWVTLFGGTELPFTPNIVSNIATAGDDEFVGGGKNDIINGFGGNDILAGSAGHDIIAGAQGNDVLDGGAQSDQLHGGGGNDVLLGGEGDDTMLGDDGNDELSGEAGSDTAYGGAGHDRLIGGDEDDILYGDFPPDISGDALLIAQLVAAQSGNDILEGGAGADMLTGGAGADTFVYAADSFGTGMDTIADFSKTEGDRLDLRGLLEGFTPGQDAIDLFVAVTANGSDTVISVDRLGAGQFTPIATLSGAAFTETVEDLVAAGHLVVS